LPRAAPSAVDAGDLTASGYVVARSKATLAAEITGKVAEVLIEEGMKVEAGQVVARLDNELSKSRMEAAEAGVGAIRADPRGRAAHLTARHCDGGGRARWRAQHD
jgi:HlyD family secretion protein